MAFKREKMSYIEPARGPGFMHYRDGAENTAAIIAANYFATDDPDDNLHPSKGPNEVRGFIRRCRDNASDAGGDDAGVLCLVNGKDGTTSVVLKVNSLGNVTIKAAGWTQKL